jgi:hypothetical protein
MAWRCPFIFRFQESLPLAATIFLTSGSNKLDFEVCWKKWTPSVINCDQRRSPDGEDTTAVVI